MSGFQERELGDSGVRLPRIALGCGNFGGIGSAPAFFGRGLSGAQASELMDAAWEMGITWFDTADAYGGGASERMVGEWMRARGVRPSLTTKTFNPMDAGADHGLAPERIFRQLATSLERLGVESVELFLAHDHDPDVEIGETLGAFDSLVGAGRIRAYGVSNFSAGQLRSALEAGAPAAVQNAHSLLEREDEAELLPLCAGRGVAYLAFSPLGGGWLTGKYRRGQPFPAASRMTQRPEPYADLVSDPTFDRLERLEAIAGERGVSMAGVALAWLLADPRVSQIVVGPGRPGHLEPVREALANPLDVAEWGEIGEVFG